MAVEEGLRCLTFQATATLSAKQYFLGKIQSTGKVNVAGDGVAADGVIQDGAPVANGATSLAIAGRSKIYIGATLVPGNNVASNASGHAVPATTGEYIIGTCTEGGTVGTIGSMIIKLGGRVA